MWINRTITQTLKELAKTRPCVLLTGARQTGKSSLFAKTFPNIKYVGLDLPNVSKEANENGNYFLEKHGTPLIIDEVQNAPQLFNYLKVYVDRKRNEFGNYLLTGSQKFSFMKGVSESLSGRIGILECHTLSVEEILQTHSGEDISSKLVLDLMIKGGYPEIHALNLNVQRFFSDYVATYIERDVRQLVNIKDLSQFDTFLRMLALQSGQVLNLSSLSKKVGVSSHTIKNWLSILEASNIIYLLKPFFNNYGKRLTKSPKVYFLDNGLLCFLTGIYDEKTLENSALLGSFFETFVLQQLIKKSANQGMRPDLYYFRDNYGLEVNFIIPQAEKISVIESKWRLDHGNIPKNILKFVEAVGVEKINDLKVVTSSNDQFSFEKNFKISNLIDL